MDYREINNRLAAAREMRAQVLTDLVAKGWTACAAGVRKLIAAVRPAPRKARIPRSRMENPA